MRIGELKGFEQWLAGTALADDRLWQRELVQATPQEIPLFIARASLKGQRKLAFEALERMQSALIVAAVDGLIEGAELALLGAEMPHRPYLVDEFIDDLLKLRPARRAAVLFALETRTEPVEVMELTWKDVQHMHQLKPLARDVLASQARTRHLRLPYVFWEWATPEAAAPLMDLKRSAEKAFDKTWPGLQYAYNEMIWISGRADSASLLGLVEEVAKGRL